MRNTRSISSELLGVLQNQESSIDEKLLGEAISQGYFSQVCQIIAKSENIEPIFEPIRDIFLKTNFQSIQNQSDLTALILTIMLQSYKCADSNLKMEEWISVLRPKSDFLFLINAFLQRTKKEVKRSHSKSSLSQSKSTPEFFSINVLQQRLFEFLTEKSSKIQIKSVLPNKESLFAEERNTLNNKSLQTHQICTSFLKSKDISTFSEDISTFLEECPNVLKNVIEKGKKHTASLSLSEMALSKIKKISNDFSLRYFQMILNSQDDDINSVLAQIQSDLFSESFTFETALILSEFISLLLNRNDNAKLKSTVQLFQKAITGFKKLFAENKTYERLYKSCVLYPQKRNSFLNDPTTETSRMLISFGQSLIYTQYVIKAAFVNSVICLERASSIQSFVNPELLNKLANDTNVFYHQAIAIDNKVRALLKELKPYPWLNHPEEKFVFNDVFIKYPFKPEIKLENASVQTIFDLFNIKTKLESLLPFGVLSTKIPVCGNCGIYPAQLICGHCEQFVLCSRCSNHNCPVCKNPL